MSSANYVVRVLLLCTFGKPRPEEARDGHKEWEYRYPISRCGLQNGNSRLYADFPAVDSNSCHSHHRVPRLILLTISCHRRPALMIKNGVHVRPWDTLRGRARRPTMHRALASVRRPSLLLREWCSLFPRKHPMSSIVISGRDIRYPPFPRVYLTDHSPLKRSRQRIGIALRPRLGTTQCRRSRYYRASILG